MEVWEREASKALQEGRIDFVPLDFLNEAPVAGMDVYYVGSALGTSILNTYLLFTAKLCFILYNWPDVEVLTILRNVRKAMAPHSRLLIRTCILPQFRSSDQIAVIQMINLLQVQTRELRELISSVLCSIIGADLHNIVQVPAPMLPIFGGGNVLQNDLAMLLFCNGMGHHVDDLIDLA